MEPPRLDLGLVRTDLGRYAQAEVVLRNVLRDNPESVPAHVCLGATLAGRGDRAGASQHFRQALLLDPGLPRAAAGLHALGEDSKTERQLKERASSDISSMRRPLGRENNGFPDRVSHGIVR